MCLSVLPHLCTTSIVTIILYCSYIILFIVYAGRSALRRNLRNRAGISIILFLWIFLWESSCENLLVRIFMWESSCENILVRIFLWESSCENLFVPVGSSRLVWYYGVCFMSDSLLVWYPPRVENYVLWLGVYEYFNFSGFTTINCLLSYCCFCVDFCTWGYASRIIWASVSCMFYCARAVSWHYIPISIYISFWYNDTTRIKVHNCCSEAITIPICHLARLLTIIFTIWLYFCCLLWCCSVVVRDIAAILFCFRIPFLVRDSVSCLSLSLCASGDTVDYLSDCILLIRSLLKFCFIICMIYHPYCCLQHHHAPPIRRLLSIPSLTS